MAALFLGAFLEKCPVKVGISVGYSSRYRSVYLAGYVAGDHPLVRINFARFPRNEGTRRLQLYREYGLRDSPLAATLHLAALRKYIPLAAVSGFDTGSRTEPHAHDHALRYISK